MKSLMAAIAALFFASLANPAEAMSNKQNTERCNWTNEGRVICVGGSVTARAPAQSRRAARAQYRRVAAYDANANGVTMLPHPPGCPSRAFCACGASVRVFGYSIRSLWPSRAWYRFPRDAAASGNVAVKPGHVFVLESHISGNDWWVSDYNSGGHKSRRHIRSIAGYTIVNPRGQRAASLATHSRL